MRLPTRAALLLGACLLVVACGHAWAGGFSVNPIHLELKPSQSATSLTVQNFNSAPLLLQVRVYRWEHKDREEVLRDVASDEAPLVTPPLFRLAANGGSQVIRIGFLRAAVVAEERQWRVIVEEVPTLTAADTAPDTTASVAPVAPSAASPAGVADAASPAIAIAVHVRVSLPLLQVPQVVQQDLQWTLQRSTAGQVQLTADNLGTVTERLDDIRLGEGDGRSARVSGPLYVFPGERRSFDMHPDAVLPPGNVRLSVHGTPRPLMHELQLSAQ